MDGGLARRGREAQVDARARAKAVRRHERAVARYESRLARTRRAVPVNGAAAGAGAVLLLADVGAEPLWVVLVAVCGLRAVKAVATLRHPPPAPVPSPALTAPPPPPPGSVASPAVQRLDAARDQTERLALLVGPAGQTAAAEALAAAREADTALRWQAARLAAVEPHLGVEPALLQALFDGVACQERVVTGLADLVAASDPHAPPSAERLRDAADALHGLAHGLRSLR